MVSLKAVSKLIISSLLVLVLVLGLCGPVQAASLTDRYTVVVIWVSQPPYPTDMSYTYVFRETTTGESYTLIVPATNDLNHDPNIFHYEATIDLPQTNSLGNPAVFGISTAIDYHTFIRDGGYYAVSTAENASRPATYNANHNYYKRTRMPQEQLNPNVNIRFIGGPAQPTSLTLDMSSWRLDYSQPEPYPHIIYKETKAINVINPNLVDRMVDLFALFGDVNTKYQQYRIEDLKWNRTEISGENIFTLTAADVDGYEKVVTGNVIEGWTVTYTKMEDIVASKTWVNGLTSDHTAPTMTLLRNGAVMDTQPLIEITPSAGTSDTFNYTWKGLPAADATNAAYTYTVQEEGAVDGKYIAASGQVYDVAQEGNNITNTFTGGPARSVYVRNVWDTDSVLPPSGSFPSVQIQLYRTYAGGGNPVAYQSPKTVPAGTAFNYDLQWDGLETYTPNGLPYVYSVKEVSEPTGFAVTYTGDQTGAGLGQGLIVTNTLQHGKISLFKGLLDADDTNTIINNGTKFVFKIEGEAALDDGLFRVEIVHFDSTPSTVLTVASGGTFELSSEQEIAQIDWIKLGVPFTITEIVDNSEYTTYSRNMPNDTVQGPVCTVTLSEAEPTAGIYYQNQRVGSVSVEKQWVNDTGEPNPQSVEVQLLRDGAPFMTKTLTDASTPDTWKDTFLKVNKYQPDGTTPYIYTLTETQVPGYTTDVTGDTAAGFVVVNTRETTSITVKKVWVNATGLSDPTSVTVELRQNGNSFVPARTLTLNSDSDWTGIFSDLAAKDANGNAYAYTVTEPTMPVGYTLGAVTGTGTDADPFVLTNTRKTPAPIELIIAGTKKLSGATLLADQFRFTLTNPDNNTEEARNGVDGRFTFPAYEVTLPGDYTFKVEEASGSAAGMTYDSAKYVVVVSIALAPLTGELDTNAVTTITRNGEPHAGDILFENAYVAPTPEPTPKPTPSPSYPAITVDIADGVKQLRNRPLKAGEFMFTIKDAAGNVLERVLNAADGTIDFAPRRFSRPGRFLYKIEEVKGSGNKVTYDSTVYTAHVDVTVQGDTLSYSVTILKDGVPYAGSPLFVNYYDPPQTGDSAFQTIFLLLGLSVLAGIAWMIIKKRGKNKD